MQINHWQVEEFRGICFSTSQLACSCVTKAKQNATAILRGMPRWPAVVSTYMLLKKKLNLSNFKRYTLASELACSHVTQMMRRACDCNALQHTAPYMTAMLCNTYDCNTLQHIWCAVYVIATHCNTWLQHTATHDCNALQHMTATYCNPYDDSYM